MLVEESSIMKDTTHWTKEAICAEMDRLCLMLSASYAVKETAKARCREALEVGLGRGRSMQSFIMATLFVSMRENEEPMTFRDYALKIEADQRKANEIAKYYRTIIEKLEIKMPVADPSGFVSEIATKVHKSGAVINLCKEILGLAKRDAVEASCRDPLVLAAAAMYTACVTLGERITEQEVAEAAGVTEGCVRSSIKSLRKLPGLVPDSPNLLHQDRAQIIS